MSTMSFVTLAVDLSSGDALKNYVKHHMADDMDRRSHFKKSLQSDDRHVVSLIKHFASKRHALLGIYTRSLGTPIDFTSE